MTSECLIPCLCLAAQSIRWVNFCPFMEFSLGSGSRTLPTPLGSSFHTQGSLVPASDSTGHLTCFGLSHRGVTHDALLSVCSPPATELICAAALRCALLGLVAGLCSLEDCVLIHTLFTLLLMDTWRVSSFHRPQTMLLCRPCVAGEPVCASAGVSVWYHSCMAPGSPREPHRPVEHHFPIAVFSRPLSRQHLRGLVAPPLPVLGSALLLYFSLSWDPVVDLICTSLVFQLLRTSSCDD